MAAVVVAWVGTGKVADGSAAPSVTITGAGSATVQSDAFVEGTNSISEKVSAATVFIAYTGTAITGEPFNLSSTSEHIYVWLNIGGGWDSLANGGFGIVVVDDAATDSVGQWYVGPRPGYLGGWVCFVVHPEKDFHTVTAGTAGWTLTGNPGQLNPVDGIGGRWKVTTTIMGASDNAYMDAVSLGTGYRLTLGDAGSTEGKFSDFITFEENVSNRFGGLFSQSGILFAQCQLNIGVASGAGNTEFIDDGFTVVWIDAQTATESAVQAGFYALNCVRGTGTTDVTLRNGLLSAVSPQEFLLDLAGITSATIESITVDRAQLVNLDGAVSWNGGIIKNSGLIDLGGQPTFTNISIIDPTDNRALEINATNELTNVSNIAFDGAGVGGTSSDGAVYINITGAGPFTLDFDGFTYANRVSGSVDIVIAANGNADYTLNITNGSSPTVTNLGTGSVTLVVDPVTVAVNVKNTSGSNIQDARVMLRAADGTGPFPFEESVTITNSGTTATVAHTAHGMQTGDKVDIEDASHWQNNGIFTITVTGVNGYTYTLPSAPGSNPTGSITATFVALSGLTDASGNLSVSRVYGTSQPIVGWIRKSTSAPFYKTANVSGTVSNTSGFSTNVQLILDQ